jgi:peptidoglycan/LPS O-acetylase OafA/YrhL
MFVAERIFWFRQYRNWIFIVAIVFRSEDKKRCLPPQGHRSLGSIVLLALLVLAVLLMELVSLEEWNRIVVKALLLRRMQLSQVSKLPKSELDL